MMLGLDFTVIFKKGTLHVHMNYFKISRQK